MPTHDARFRYQTAALLGPWRDTAEAAAADAVRAGQAVRNGAEPTQLHWLVNGSIEAQPPEQS